MRELVAARPGSSATSPRGRRRRDAIYERFLAVTGLGRRAAESPLSKRSVTTTRIRSLTTAAATRPRRRADRARSRGLRDRDALVGLRRLRHSLRRRSRSRAAPRRLREARGRGRGAPPDRRRARGRAALPVGRGRRLRRAARRMLSRARAADRRGQPEPVPGPRLQARLDHATRTPRIRRQGGRSPARVRRDRRRRSARPPSRSGSPTAPTTPGQDNLLARRAAARDCLRRALRRAARAIRSCSSSTSSSSRRSTRPTSPTGARRC